MTIPTRTLRARHNDHTRELILEALVSLLADTGVIEFSFFELARRAELSPRTIYRHFATRDELFAALTDYINARLGFTEYPQDVDGTVELARQLFVQMDANEQLMIAHIEAPGAQPVRLRSRDERAQAFLRLIGHEAPQLPIAQRRETAAVLHSLLSTNTWHRAREDLGLDGAATGEAVAHAVRLIIEDAAARSASRATRRRKATR